MATNGNGSSEGAGASGGARSRLLIASDDGGLLRRLRPLLVASERFVLAFATDRAELEQELAHQDFDAVLIDPGLPGCGPDGPLGLVAATPLSDTLVRIALLRTGRADLRLQAWRQGVADCIVWPVADEELIVRLQAAIARGRRTGVARPRKSDLSGDLACAAFTEVINLLSALGRDGVLAIQTERGRAKVLFHQGRIVHATFGDLTGHAVVFALMAEESGSFEFQSIAIELESLRRTVTWEPTALIIEGARLIDERRNRLSFPETAEVGPAPSPEPSEPH